MLCELTNSKADLFIKQVIVPSLHLLHVVLQHGLLIIIRIQNPIDPLYSSVVFSIFLPVTVHGSTAGVVAMCTICNVIMSKLIGQSIAGCLSRKVLIIATYVTS